MQIHIGQKIQEVYREKGWTLEHFAKKINMTTRNAQYIFKRKDISIEQLRAISEAMEYDFVKLFLLDNTKFSVEDPKGNYKDPAAEFMSMNISFKISGNQENYKKLPDLIKRIKNTAEQLGFNVN
jgi:transcriptional regulator with XRE-family HTH domain